MGVVGHGYCGFGGGLDGGGGWYVLEKKPRWFAGCQNTPCVRCEDTDDTRSNRLPGAQLWVGSELVGLPGKALTWDAMRSLRFVVHAACWLHSMVFYRCCGCCSRS